MLSTIDAPTLDPITLRNRPRRDVQDPAEQRATGARPGTAVPERCHATAVAGSRVASRLYGLLTNAPIASDLEQQADWEAHLADYLDYLDPRDHPECVLAEHIALLHWRRARLERYETAAINAHLQDFEASLQAQPAPAAGSPATPGQPAAVSQTKPLTTDQIAARRALCLLPDYKTMDRIVRYGSQISKDIERTQARLHQLKATRAQRWRRLGTHPDLAPDALTPADPILDMPARQALQPRPPCDDAPARAATAGAAIPAAASPAFPAEAAEAVCSDPAQSVPATGAPKPATIAKSALRAKQSQSAPGAGRSVRPAHAARSARKRHK